MRLHGDATVTALFFYDEGFGAGWGRLWGWLGRGLGGARAGFGGVGGVGRWVVYSVLSIRLPSPAAMEVHKATQCFRRGFRQRFSVLGGCQWLPEVCEAVRGWLYVQTGGIFLGWLHGKKRGGT